MNGLDLIKQTKDKIAPEIEALENSCYRAAIGTGLELEMLATFWVALGEIVHERQRKIYETMEARK